MKHSFQSNKKADNWEIDGFQSRNLPFLSNRGSIKTQLDCKMKALNPELVALRKLRICNLAICGGSIGPGAKKAPWLRTLAL